MAAEHGDAVAVGGETEAALPELGRRRKCEHSLKEGEAELRARDCQPRWGSRGEFRRRVRGAARGRAWGSRLWRKGKAAREGVSELTGTSRCRRARGRGRRSWLPRGVRCQRRAATRRASSAAVGTRGAARAGARRQAGRGAVLGWAERGEARAAWEARWAGMRGWAGKEAAARENRNTLFNFQFQ